MKRLHFTPENPNGQLIDLTDNEKSFVEELNNLTPTKLESSLKFLRIKRNNLLKETDWYANSDLTMSSDMTTYRQALRDLTNGLDTIAKVETKLEIEDGKYKNFPTKP